jgi:hypothetical protein
MLVVGWIVGRVHIGHGERAISRNLHHRPALGPGVVVHLRRRRREAAGSEIGALGLVKLVAHAQREIARDHRQILVRRVVVCRDFVARRYHQPDYERPCLAGITRQHRHLSASREHGRRGAPLQVGGTTRASMLPRTKAILSIVVLLAASHI